MTRSVEDRFAGFVEMVPESACWYWTGSINPNGYGYFSKYQNRKITAHRAAYELFKGPIPKGLEIDHLCMERSCVNPRHLEAVTHAENLRRSPSHVSNINRDKTKCVRGHSEFSRKPGGRRTCAECMRIRGRAQYFGVSFDDAAKIVTVVYPKRTCKRGHLRAPENLGSGGMCLLCRRERRKNGKR